MALADTIKGFFTGTKNIIMSVVGIVVTVIVLAGIIWVIIYLAGKNKKLVIHPTITVIDISNPQGNISQKSLNEAVSIGKEIFNKIKGVK